LIHLSQVFPTPYDLTPWSTNITPALEDAGATLLKLPQHQAAKKHHTSLAAMKTSMQSMQSSVSSGFRFTTSAEVKALFPTSAPRKDAAPGEIGLAMLEDGRAATFKPEQKVLGKGSPLTTRTASLLYLACRAASGSRFTPSSAIEALFPAGAPICMAICEGAFHEFLLTLGCDVLHPES